MRKSGEQKLFGSVFVASLGIGAALGLLATSCQPAGEQQKSKIMFTMGLEMLDFTRGHEDLTRFAVDLANKRVKETQNLLEYFIPILVGDNGARSPTPMINGVYDTDWAVSLVGNKIARADLIEFYGVGWVKTGMEWQEHPYLQSLHFLRDRELTGQVYGFQESLEAGREKISRAYDQAVRVAFDRNLSFYWLGHAAHIIQDSFSNAHTQRSSDFRNITDICVFGIENATEPGDATKKVCVHPKVASVNWEEGFKSAALEQDRVWLKQPSECNSDRNVRTWACL
jgi:hypothetical protein